MIPIFCILRRDFNVALRCLISKKDFRKKKLLRILADEIIYCRRRQEQPLECDRRKAHRCTECTVKTSLPMLDGGPISCAEFIYCAGPALAALGLSYMRTPSTSGFFYGMSVRAGRLFFYGYFICCVSRLWYSHSKFENS
ncbi:unnamed protein product [Amoebophrya sp. A25]|nr:unnamed protein product [Amoebophrya sp. A25]|eukprot:GSA25T00002116001.1